MTDALVEHVDIMATLLEAAGLDAMPLCPESSPWEVAKCTEGTSFMKLIDEPNTVRTQPFFCSLSWLT